MGPCGSQVQVQLQGGHRPPPPRGLAPDLWPRQPLTLSTLQPGKHPRMSPAHSPGTLPMGPSYSLAPRQPLSPWCLQHGHSQAVPGPGAALTPTSKLPEPSSLEQGERAPRTLHGQSAVLTSPPPGERAQPTAQDDLFDSTVLLSRGPGHRMATICLGPIGPQPRLCGAEATQGWQGHSRGQRRSLHQDPALQAAGRPPRDPRPVCHYRAALNACPAAAPHTRAPQGAQCPADTHQLPQGLCCPCWGTLPKPPPTTATIQDLRKHHLHTGPLLDTPTPCS